MNARTPILPGACWRRRFLAIARQAEEAGARAPAAPIGMRPGLRRGEPRLFAPAARP
jgi:hypothetical protein